MPLRSCRRTAFALALIALSAPSLAAQPIRVAGRILRGDGGRGISGARIELLPGFQSPSEALRQLREKAGPSPLASSRTREDGSFEIVAPGSGFYKVVVRADGYGTEEHLLAPLVEETDLIPDSLLKVEPLEIRAVGGDGRPLSGVEIRLDSPRFLDEIPWRTADQRGVTGAQGRIALPRSRVNRSRLITVSPRFLGQTLEIPAQPEPVATFRLVDREPVEIEVRDADGRPVADALVHWKSWLVGATGPEGRLTVTLPDGDEPLRIEGPNGWQGRIAALASSGAGRVRIVRLEAPRVLTGRVIDALSRRPVPGALVWGGRPPVTPPVRTGADGTFRLETPGGAEGAWIGTAAAGFLNAAPRFVPGAEKAPLTLTLDPAATISGIVVDAAGRPVSGAMVQPQPAPPRSPMGIAEVTTRPDGRFRIPRLLPRGTYELQVSGPGLVRTSVKVRTSAPGGSAPEVRIVLPEGATAFGRVEDETGRPVSGVSLTLQPPLPEALVTSYEAVSDEAGRFEIRHLSPGRYDLLAERAGFSPAEKTGLEVPESGGRIDLGVLTLSPGAVIEGLVTDAGGSPLEGVQIYVLPRESRVSRQSLFSEGTEVRVKTRLDGSFRFEDLKPGAAYHLRTEHPGYTEGEATGVVAPTQEPVRIELRTARSLSGRIVGPAGEPVPNASLAWVEESFSGSSQGTGSGSSRALALGSSASDGTFEVSGLRPGPVDLEVSAREYQRKRVPGIPIPEDRDVEGLEIVLERGSVLAVRVLSGSGEPVPDLWVHAFREDPENPFGHLRFADDDLRTDSQGRCLIEIPGPGRYRVEASRMSRRASAVVAAGPGTTPVDLQMGQGAEVSGRVIGEDGEGIAGVGVSLEDAATNQRSRSEGWSDADGSFVVFDVADGSFRVKAARPGYAQTTLPPEIEVAGQPVRGVEVRLSEAEPDRGAITGRILGLAPDDLARVRILVIGEQGMARSLDRISADGTYRLEKVPPGDWTVRAFLGSGPQAHGAVHLDPGASEAVLDLEFAGSITLSGRVLLDGAPLAGAEVSLIPKSGGSTVSDRTLYDGSFTLHNVRRGSHTLRASSPGIGDFRTVEVSGDDRPLLVEISTGRITGRLSRTTGEPVPDTAIQMEGWNKALNYFFTVPSTRTNDEGVFESVRLAPGLYKLKVRKEGFAQAETTITVRPGETAEAAISLTPVE